MARDNKEDKGTSGDKKSKKQNIKQSNKQNNKLSNTKRNDNKLSNKKRNGNTNKSGETKPNNDPKTQPGRVWAYPWVGAGLMVALVTVATMLDEQLNWVEKSSEIGLSTSPALLHAGVHTCLTLFVLKSRWAPVAASLISWGFTTATMIILEYILVPYEQQVDILYAVYYSTVLTGLSLPGLLVDYVRHLRAKKSTEIKIEQPPH